jgi:hypothetical protein
MSPQEFHDYKASKYTRILWYILAMIFVSLFKDRGFGYTMLTLSLIISYWVDAKKEKQWKKDGNVRDEDLK